MMDFTQTRQPISDFTMPDLSEFMTTQEAATRLGFHIKTNPMMLRNKTLGDIRFGCAWLVSNFTETSISAD